MNKIGIEPELILAEGKNGTVGYVKAEDLNSFEPSSLEEAIEYQKNMSTQREIPLYNSDGLTVIDMFIVSNFDI